MLDTNTCETGGGGMLSSDMSDSDRLRAKLGLPVRSSFFESLLASSGLLEAREASEPRPPSEACPPPYDRAPTGEGPAVAAVASSLFKTEDALMLRPACTPGLARPAAQEPERRP